MQAAVDDVHLQLQRDHGGLLDPATIGPVTHRKKGRRETLSFVEAPIPVQQTIVMAYRDVEPVLACLGGDTEPARESTTRHTGQAAPVRNVDRTTQLSTMPMQRLQARVQLGERRAEPHACHGFIRAC